MQVTILGCGYVGAAIARAWRARGARVTVLRRGGGADELASHGIECHRADLDRPETLAGLPVDGAILYWLAPPPGGGATDPRLRGVLEAVPSFGRPARVVYASTSGVYGDCGGAWVTEDHPLAPGTERAHRRADAEAALATYSAASGVPVVVMRIGGIYGPGRFPEERLRAGLPVVRPEEAPPSNRIHIEDLAGVALALADPGVAPGAYNVADGHPTTMTDYFLRAAAALGLPPPPQIPLAEARAVLGAGMASYLEEAKRLDIGKLERATGYAFRYPDLDSGLPASV